VVELNNREVRLEALHFFQNPAADLRVLANPAFLFRRQTPWFLQNKVGDSDFPQA
jgi:hypothetical protein